MSARVTTLADRQAALWSLRQRARQARVRVVGGGDVSVREDATTQPSAAQRPATEPPVSGVRHRKPSAKED